MACRVALRCCTSTRLVCAKFDRPSHWATRQRAEEHKTPKAGEVVVIGVADDHIRLAY